ncbi:hypothetical protein GCM10010275_69250 [Streptomyces litmocidini]|nr:hypothetical protein GCM10010275_69250 [Streptomyces litmocidini]
MSYATTYETPARRRSIQREGAKTTDSASPGEWMQEAAPVETIHEVQGRRRHTFLEDSIGCAECTRGDAS